MKSKLSKKLVTTGLLSLLSLSSGITGTLAWFTANRQVSVEAGSFEVVTPEGQEADLYYHNLNFNETLQQYAGFEKASLNDENYSSFTKIDEDSSLTPSPVSTNYLWPNFQLTYALVFTPIRKGTFSFKLKSWKSEASTNKFVSNDKGIRLSWAINMYAYIYEDNTNFSNAKDYFNNHENTSFFSSKQNDKSDISEQGNITVDVSDNTKSYVVYFSVEFSNDSSTYYEKNESDEYWSQSSTSSTQSMCYEGLTFNVEKFVLDIPSEQL